MTTASVQPSVIGDETSAAVALARMKRGEVLLYRGDFRNARQLLSAVERRLEKKRPVPKSGNPRDLFFAEREAKAFEAAVLSRLVVRMSADCRIEAERAPDCSEAWRAAFGDAKPYVPVRELLGVIGAHEWRKKGIFVRALGAPVFPHYGVFGPVRQEYVDLVAAMPPLGGMRVFDVGTGTGVLAILGAKKGAASVVATDIDPRAVACARENVARFDVPVVVEERDLLPDGRADVVIFNPPWLPARPKTSIDRAVYDEGGLTVRRFFSVVRSSLSVDGVVWFVMSDLAERIGIRRPGLLEELWTSGGLRLREKHEMRPSHPRSGDSEDLLFAARSGEVTSLFVLGVS